MASQRIGSIHGVVSTNTANGTQRSNMNGATSPSLEEGYADNSMNSMFTMISALQAANPGEYTTDMINKMTYNDILFAYRQTIAPDRIKDL